MADSIWEVRVEGQARDLQRLAQVFTSAPLAVVRNDANEYLVTSDRFIGLTDHSAVHSAASEVLTLLGGALQFQFGSHEPLETGPAFRRHGDGRRDTFIMVKGSELRLVTGDVTFVVTDKDGNPVAPPEPQIPPLRKVVNLALQRDAVAKALRLLGSAPMGWIDLYRLVEVIEHDVGGEDALVDADWTTRTQLKRFKHSANSVSVAGDEARHGKETTQSPRAPMTLEEARTYVDYLLHAWIDSRSV